MAKLIQNHRVVADKWQLLKLGADGALPSVPAEGDVLVPLKVWLAQHDALAVRAGLTGVWLDSNEGAETVAADLKRLPLIAINFPAFTDGRGYSTARLLRERYGYSGELRAIGDVGRDHLLNMQRCGFDAYLLREDEDVEVALTAFDDLPVAYQASVVEPQPLFRRRQG
ncbi:MAG: DUF934 domain-containing protein [Burkholderiales bacterium]